MKRKSVPYPIEFIPKTITSFLNWRGKECLSVWDFDESEEQNYTLSGEMKDFDLMRAKLKTAEADKKPIKIIYIKKSGRRFINQVL